MHLNPTSPEHLCDRHGRPYFAWDTDLTLDAICARLADPDPDVRAHTLAKLMRQARTDDTLSLVRVADIRSDWERVAPLLGDRRAYWSWLLPELERRGA